MPKELSLIAIGLDERMKYARKEAGLTRLEVAKALKTTHHVVVMWEEENFTPSDEILAELAVLYDVRFDWLKSGALAPKTT